MKQLLCLICLLSLLGLAGCSSYAFQSETGIKTSLLQQAPLGSSSDTVRTYLRRKTGNEPHYEKNYFTFEGREAKARYFAGSIYCTLANYGQIFLVSTEVQTRWEFDPKDRLIDLRVTKQPTGP
jgi:hypothetical protein